MHDTPLPPKNPTGYKPATWNNEIKILVVYKQGNGVTQFLWESYFGTVSIYWSGVSQLAVLFPFVLYIYMLLFC